MHDVANPLGEFLRARRDLVTPAMAGIADGGVRRVPGLRREEVALLTGISADYYLRLERGRDRNPSVQVLEALARVLQLDDEHFAYLRTLVADVPRRPRRRTRTPAPPSGVLKLLDALAQPAFIEDRYFDVLASNALMRAIDPRLAPGGNQLRDMFLDPGAQALYPDWRGATECLVGSLRQAVGTDRDDQRFIDLTGELTLASPRFGTLWARHDVRRQTGGPMRFDHPLVGALTLNRERMSVAGADGLMLVVFHADAGTDDAERLGMLASAALAVPAEMRSRTVRS